ncbi:MAG: nicotinate-nucleotide diphosphorylase (carboxylating), partial [Pseudohongiellaceae bacterium]
MDLIADLESTVAQALAEDIGDGDITAALITPATQAHAEVVSRDAAVMCGRPWVTEVFHQVDADIRLVWSADDGATIAPGDRLFTADGPARGILTAERTALNFLQTLSGTATRTRHYVELVKHTKVKLLDTRKTLPGLRRAQKYAVTCGGGH